MSFFNVNAHRQAESYRSLVRFVVHPYLIVASLLIVPFSQTIAQTFAMESLLWTHRPLLIFTPSIDVGAIELRAAIRHAAAEFRDRDMILIEVYENGRAMLDGRELPEGTAQVLRQRYGVAEGETTLILVGKDGGEKLRASDFSDLEPFSDQIDTMPMRRDEMRQRSRPGAVPQNE